MTTGTPDAVGSVLVHSSSAIVRRGLEALLEDDGWDVQVDDSANAEGEGLDLIVWDADSTSPGLAAVMSRYGSTPVLAVVSAQRPTDPADLLAQGVAGIVDADIDGQALCQAVRAVSEGRTVLHAGLRVDASMGRPPSLTRRELQVLELLGEGRSNRDIADALVISENTVKNHVRRLYEKLQVRSRTEAVVMGVRWGLIRLARSA